MTETAFINNLEYYRNLNKLSRKVLSEKTGISAAMIYYVEKGKKKISWELADRIASYLGYPLEEIFPKFAKRMSPLPNCTINKLG
jgi:DNA-binding XRE family transcriptional regulator